MDLDKVKTSYIEKMSKVIGHLDRFIKAPILYKLLYRNIFNFLKEDFKKAELLTKQEDFETRDEKAPLTFWFLWWQGIEKAPILIKKNFERLEKIVGKENVKLITKDNYNQFTNIPDLLVDKLRTGNVSFTNWSDIVRFYLLKDNGGYWIDSTVAISKQFYSFIEQQDKSFFSPTALSPDYHWISYAQWTSWFMGGYAHFGLFEFGCKFFEQYYKNHESNIDYFLMDDMIAYYFKSNKNFRIICSENSKEWKPYYWVNRYTENFDKQYIENFDNNLVYGIQKMTYKFNKNNYSENSFISYLTKNLNNVM